MGLSFINALELLDISVSKLDFPTPIIYACCALNALVSDRWDSGPQLISNWFSNQSLTILALASNKWLFEEVE